MNTNTVLVGAFALLLVGGGVYWALGNTSGTTPPETTNGPVTNEMPVVTSGENPEPGGIHDLSVEPAVVAARKDLAAKLSVAEKSIVIMQVSEATWSDGCLGLGGPAESCIQAEVPGFKVELLAAGKSYFYRTDKTGASVRTETE